jgi:Family of unknown function (DUF6090)
MLKFFRKIRFNLMDTGKTSKYLKYAIGEIILVVIGILIALQINNWNEQKKENNTATLLAKSLIEDLNKDVDFLKNALTFSEQKINSCDALLTLLSKPQTEWDNKQIYESFNIVGQSNPFFPTTGTYTQIVTSGSLKLFDQSLANLLNAYDMQLKKITYWSNAEDETSWLMANIIWKGMNVEAMADIRFDLPRNHDLFLKIPEESVIELTNLIAGIKTYRLKTKTEYTEQLKLAENLISSLNQNYKL